MVCTCNEQVCHCDILCAAYKRAFGQPPVARQPWRKHITNDLEDVVYDEAGQWTPTDDATASGLAETWEFITSPIYTSEVKVVWEIMAGEAAMSKAFEEAGWSVATPIDVRYNMYLDLLNPLALAHILTVIQSGRIGVLWLAPPCASFSIACNSDPDTQVRDLETAEPLPNLPPHRQERVDIGDALAEIAARLWLAQQAAGGVAIIEQPASSLMLVSKFLTRTVYKVPHFWGVRDVCLDGAPWKKPTALLCTHEAIEAINGQCQGGHKHIALRGKAPCGRNWTQVACPYWPGFA